MENRRLYRSCEDRMLGGVAGGLAEYLEVDSIIIRLLFLLILFSGFGVAAYILAWVLIPENPKCKTSKRGEDEIKEKAKDFSSKVKRMGRSDNEVKMIIGIVVLGLGALLLAENFGFRVIQFFWPVLLVILGIFIIAR